MKKRLFVLLSLLVLLFPSSALAQKDSPLSSVAVDLWPEFDRPTMLVIYHITLSPQATLPFQMGVRIPAAVGEPHAVAARQPDGSLVTIPYEQKPEADWTRIVFQATAPEIQLEYYDPGLSKDGSKRSYQYTWPGDYAVDAFSIEVQQPTGASNMQISPDMASPRQGSDGLTYFHMNVGSLSNAQVFKINLQYQKKTEELSVSNMSVAPSAPLDNSTPGGMSFTSVLPWVLGFFGLALIIGGFVWYWQSGRQRIQPAREGRGRRTAASSAPASEGGEESNIYCHQCGKRAASGDRFCRACGTPLRIS